MLREGKGYYHEVSGNSNSSDNSLGSGGQKLLEAKLKVSRLYSGCILKNSTSGTAHYIQKNTIMPRELHNIRSKIPALQVRSWLDFTPQEMKNSIFWKNKPGIYAISTTRFSYLGQVESKGIHISYLFIHKDLNPPDILKHESLGPRNNFTSSHTIGHNPL